VCISSALEELETTTYPKEPRCLLARPRHVCSSRSDVQVGVNRRWRGRLGSERSSSIRWGDWRGGTGRRIVHVKLGEEEE